MTTETIRYDLHMHSTASDGLLSPAELVRLNHENKVNVMALTDHDTCDGLVEAETEAKRVGIQLIPGIELSANWEKKIIHLVALQIDPDNPALKVALQALAEQRLQRAEKIAKKLHQAGIPNALEGAKKFAQNGLIARPHFAQFLVAEGHAKDMPNAFKKFLAQNKKAYVSTQWPTMEATIALIKQAGGIAVLAHPLRYKLTASWRRRLFSAFKAAGGQGMEVICGYYTPTEIENSTGYAHHYDLLGSVGSDFHAHSKYNKKPGQLGPLSSSLTPIWSLFK